MKIGRKFVGLSQSFEHELFMRETVGGKDLTMLAQGGVVALCLKFGFYINLAVVITAKNKLKSQIMKHNCPSPFSLSQPRPICGLFFPALF